ncbi:hypothetical protein B0T17DRAFT_502834 [Bombardia bombarda]|uniref:Uncharacterized protein n=1 Tax=Bombardia bombarda TaxID=252184 RepID=A0AA39XJR3_9PEZI|nr:hypothetical protein B0T17DRAFT_502834 [Bombardia bombarda]
MDLKSKPPIRRKPVAAPGPTVDNHATDVAPNATTSQLPPRSTTHDLIYNDDPLPYEEVAQQRPSLSIRYTAPALPPRPTLVATFSPSPQPSTSFTSFSQLPSSLSTSRSTPNLRAALDLPLPTPTPTPPNPRTTDHPPLEIRPSRDPRLRLLAHPPPRSFSILRHSPPLIIYRGPTTSGQVGSCLKGKYHLRGCQFPPLVHPGGALFEKAALFDSRGSHLLKTALRIRDRAADCGPTEAWRRSRNVVDLRPWGDAKGFDVGGGRGGRWAEGEGCGKDACMAIALLQGVVDWKGNPANAFALLCGLTWENGPTAWENICLTAAVPPA